MAFRFAAEEAIEVDWTDNPASEREAKLRLAMIHIIEKGNEGVWGALAADGSTFTAYYTLQELKGLAPLDAPEIGEDPYNSIERWRIKAAEKIAENKRREHKRLLDDARRELDDGASQSDAE